MKSKLNLDRSPFLRHALSVIRNNPGCCKADCIPSCPHRTYAHRNAAISRLIDAGLVENRGTRYGRYSLYVVCE